MGALEQIRKNAESRRTKPCKIFETDVLCVMHSAVGIRDLLTKFEAASNDNSAAAKLLAEQFLDPETHKPVLTVQFLEEQCTHADSFEVLNIFLKMNKADKDALADSEKN